MLRIRKMFCMRHVPHTLTCIGRTHRYIVTTTDQHILIGNRARIIVDVGPKMIDQTPANLFVNILESFGFVSVEIFLFNIL